MPNDFHSRNSYDKHVSNMLNEKMIFYNFLKNNLKNDRNCNHEKDEWFCSLSVETIGGLDFVQDLCHR